MRASYLFLDSEAYIEVHGEDGLVVLVLHLAVVFEDRRTEEGEEGVGLDLLLDLLGWGAAGLPLPAYKGLHLDEKDGKKRKSWGSTRTLIILVVTSLPSFHSMTQPVQAVISGPSYSRGESGLGPWRRVYCLVSTWRGLSHEPRA